MFRRLLTVVALAASLLVVAPAASPHGYCADPAYTHYHGSYKYQALNYDSGSNHWVKWNVYYKVPLGGWVKIYWFTSGPC